MCGIAGFAITKRRDDAERRLLDMTASIAHRGPDGSGHHLAVGKGETRIGLGHRRLAIIDIAGGQQPMVEEQSGVALTYNGELYNFEELRIHLSALGHNFRTLSDTEVVLRAYLHWGTDCFRRFRGMFALAVWDPRTNNLVLARDQFGKKPLFLRELDGGLVFGSEPKAVLAWSGPAPTLDLASVMDFLSWRYVPGPHTLFAGIRKLPPGHWAVWDGTKLREQRYFVPPYALQYSDGHIADPVKPFLACLEEAVRLRMASDVPFGAFLSGGIDSSAVVALMARYSRGPVRTFSVGFAEARHSELPYAALVARTFGTHHEEIVVSAQDIMGFLPELIRKSDGPVSEPSNIPIWLLARAAARSVKMVLTGEGADELLGGYPKHWAEQYARIWHLMVPATIQNHIIDPIANRLPAPYQRFSTLLNSIGLRDPQERFPRWMGTLCSAERDRLVAFRLARRNIDKMVFEETTGRSPLQQLLLFDQISWLPDNLLERGDRMTMAASIEARMPFMDTCLAAMVANLPDQWRIRGRSGKYILRKAMEGILPEQILSRKKIGFRVPVAEWFRGTMRDYMRSHLDSASSLTRSLYAGRHINKILVEHETGKRNHEKLLWSLLNLELFQREYRLPSAALNNASQPTTLVAA